MSSYEGNVPTVVLYFPVGSVQISFPPPPPETNKKTYSNISICFSIFTQRKRCIHYCIFPVFSYDCYVDNKVVTQNSLINVLGRLLKTKYAHIIKKISYTIPFSGFAILSYPKLFT